MDDTAIITILAIAGVASVLLYVVKGFLDQVPEVIESAGRIRVSWQRFKRPDLPASADDQEPPAAA
ncbi:hypothetical protein ACWF76_11850 [Streptomyces globisporus]|uniref:Uncharacterized protein n=1 Tax=Streptomyces globisporus TaxID=1908 RepID=A0A423UTQ0_STRGL|nr:MULTISPECIES: hypothetical protein [Streptomyces]ROV65710.1 hypothetical protein D3105_25925 [Streptomyces globisporus]